MIGQSELGKCALGELILTTSLVTLTVRARSFTLNCKERVGLYMPALVVLEDNSGYLLFEDSDRMMFESGDEGAPLIVRERSFILTAKDRE